MNKATVVTLIVIVLLLLIGWFAFWRDGGQIEPVIQDETEMEADEAMLITAKHEWSEGTHVIAGEVNLPTPCHILNTSVDVTKGTDPDQAIINFESTTQAETCIQVIAPTRFKVEFEADENVEISATWNGAVVDLNLIPVAQGESLDDFEIFIKG